MATKKDLSRKAVAARARAKGLHPTKAQIEKTYRRNLLRVNKNLAYSTLASKSDVERELAAIKSRSKKKYGKEPSRAQAMATYRRNRTKVLAAMNKTRAGIAARSRAKYGRAPRSAAVTKTYYNDIWAEYLHPRGRGGKFRRK